jgi:hypothetical protein
MPYALLRNGGVGDFKSTPVSPNGTDATNGSDADHGSELLTLFQRYEQCQVHDLQKNSLINVRIPHAQPLLHH